MMTIMIIKGDEDDGDYGDDDDLDPGVVQLHLGLLLAPLGRVEQAAALLKFPKEGVGSAVGQAGLVRHLHVETMRLCPMASFHVFASSGFLLPPTQMAQIIYN